MENEFIFRVLVFSLFISFIAHRGYYHRKLTQVDANVVKQPERGLTPFVGNLLSLSGLVAVFLYVIDPARMVWASLPLPVWLRWSGVGIALGGFVLLQWAQLTLGKSWSSSPRLLKGQILVTNGPYRWVRHPIYTAFLLIMSVPLLLSANWFIGGAWLGMTLLDVLSRMTHEESLMQEAFGSEYRAYMSKTGRLLPRFI